MSNHCLSFTSSKQSKSSTFTKPNLRPKLECGPCYMSHSKQKLMRFQLISETNWSNVTIWLKLEKCNSKVQFLVQCWPAHIPSSSQRATYSIFELLDDIWSLYTSCTGCKTLFCLLFKRSFRNCDFLGSVEPIRVPLPPHLVLTFHICALISYLQCWSDNKLNTVRNYLS